MDFVNAMISDSAREWWQAHGVTVFMATLLIIQWIALQALLIHYHFFRKNLKQPKPDGVRIALLERTVALQTDQLDKIFGKLAHFNREIDSLHVHGKQATRTAKEPSGVTSIEASVATLGEIALKKRIQEIQKAIN